MLPKSMVGARARLIILPALLMTMLMLLVPLSGIGVDKVGQRDNDTLDFSSSSLRSEPSDSIDDFAIGGYNILTNDWWQPSASKFNVTASDSDGDGWMNSDDLRPHDPAYPAPTNAPACMSPKPGCTHSAEGFGGAEQPDFVIPGGYTREMSLGDFDGDGDLDFSRANDRPNYLTNENGTFEGGTSWRGENVRQSTAVAWADIDGDGDLDLSAGNSPYSDPSNDEIFLNENGSISRTPFFETAEEYYTHDIEWGSITDDVYLDMVAGTSEGNILFYLNFGDGFDAADDPSNCNTLAPNCITAFYSTSFGTPISDVDLIDFDLDGDLDIFVAADSSIQLLVNDISANGTFWIPSSFAPDDVNGVREVALGDIDGDGWPDLVIGGFLSPLRAFRNLGGVISNDVWWSSSSPVSSGGLELADMDKDGDLDLVAGFDGSRNGIFINRNGMLENDPSWESATLDVTLSVEVGDIDGDGDNDVIFGNANIADEVYLNHDRAVSRDYGWNDGILANTEVVKAADVNADGFMDLFVGNLALTEESEAFGLGANGTDLLYLGTEQGLSATPAWQSNDSFSTNSAAWFDFDLDGDLDIYVGIRGYDVIYLNEAGSLSIDPIWISPYYTYTRDVEIADFDNDGDFDIAVATSSGADHMYKCCSLDGEPVLVWIPDAGVEEQAYAVSSGDLDNDGYLDLVFASYLRWGENRVYLNTGAGPADYDQYPTSPSFTLNSEDSTDVEIADIDADGWNDILFSEDIYRNSIYYYNGTVNGTLTYAKVKAGGWGFTNAVDVGDIDADGDLDVVWAYADEPTSVSIMVDGRPSANWKTTASLATYDVELADVSGDGALDIIIANGGGLFENVIFESGTDGDGDWVIDGLDDFPLDPTQATDDDGDGYGDHTTGRLPDDCKLYRGDSWRDRWGCPDMDGDGQSDLNDAFMTQMTQWIDTDGDGFGDNWGGDPVNTTRSEDWPGEWMVDAYLSDPSPLDFDNDGYEDESLESYGANAPFDQCSLWYGTSNLDRFGCLDSDGDGWSDIGDDLPTEPTQHIDSDGDGWGDNQAGMRADIYPYDATQWTDSDGDLFGDNPLGATPDAYPLDSSQWNDSDGDGFGDNPFGTAPDGCPTLSGDSTKDLLGCHDADGDGWSNLSDFDDADASVWSDSDGDGFPDQLASAISDDCPGQVGFSSDVMRGCPDMDGDGMPDIFDDDADGDGISNSMEREASRGGYDWDPYNATSTPWDFDGDRIPDAVDLDDDDDGFPDDLEDERGSDPLDARQTPLNMFGKSDSGFYYVPGTGFQSGFANDGYEISLSAFMSLITSEYLLPLILMPISLVLLLRKRRRFKKMRRRLGQAEHQTELDQLEEDIDGLIVRGKIKVEHGLLLRNQYERKRGEVGEKAKKRALGGPPGRRRMAAAQRSGYGRAGGSVMGPPSRRRIPSNDDDIR